MYDIDIVSWSSDSVDKSKSTCLLRLRTVSGEDVVSKICIYVMGRSSGRIQNARFFLRIAGNRWRSNWIRLEYFPRKYVIADSSENPERFARAEHWTRKIHMIGSSSCQWSTRLIGQTKEERWFVISNSEKSRDTREGILARTLDVPRSWKMKRSGMEKQSTLLKESVIQWRLRWHSDSRKQVAQSSQVSMHWVVEFWDCWQEKKPYTSKWMLQTQNSCSESFILWISLELVCSSSSELVPWEMGLSMHATITGGGGPVKGPESVCAKEYLWNCVVAHAGRP